MPDFVLSLLPGLTWPQAALLAVTVFLAGLLRGFTGFGFALAAIPVLTLFLPPGAIVPAVSVVALLAGIELLPKAWPAANFRAIRRLLIGALVGTPFGAYLLAVLPADPMRLIIGGIVLLAALLLWRGARFSRQPPLGGQVAIGALSGLLNGATAMGGPPVILYFLAAPEGMAAGRASLLVYFFFLSLWSLAMMAWQGLLGWPSLLLALLMTPAMALGNRLGSRLFDRSSADLYRRVALAFLATTALLAIARAVTGEW